MSEQRPPVLRDVLEAMFGAIGTEVDPEELNLGIIDSAARMRALFEARQMKQPPESDIDGQA